MLKKQRIGLIDPPAVKSHHPNTIKYKNKKDIHCPESIAKTTKQNMQYLTLLLSQQCQQPVYKLNTIRNMNISAKDQIVNLKARINKLKEENQRNKRRSMRSYQEIERMLSTKFNYIEKKRNKSLHEQNSMSERLEKIENAKLARIKEKEALESSRQNNYEDKSTKALIQRQIKAIESQTIRLQKQKSQQLNAQRAKNIKQYQKQHKNYMSILNQFSRVKARSNHQQKVQKCVKQKEMLNKTMNMLRKQEKSLINQLRKETQDLKSIEDEIQMIRTRTRRSFTNK